MKTKTRTPPPSRKITDEQRQEIISEYLEERTPMWVLGERYGVNKSTISRIICNSGVLDEAERKADIRSKLALINLKNASADASEKLVELLNKKRGEKQVYADIQIIQQVLDRAGVRATKEEKQELNIKFNTGGITLGVPDHSKDGQK